MLPKHLERMKRTKDHEEKRGRFTKGRGKPYKVGGFLLSVGILLFGLGLILMGTRSEIPPSAAAGASSISAVKLPRQVPPVSPKKETVPEALMASQGILPTSWLQVLELEKGELVIVAGRSHVLRFAKAIGRVAVSEPEILDFLLLSPTELLLNAREQGAVNLIIWDTENQVSNIDVNVINDPTLLKRLLEKIDPKGRFEVYPSKDVFVVEGETSSVLKAREVADAANAFAEGSVSLTRVKSTKQILLQIRFIQVDLEQDFDFGIDWEHADVINDHMWWQRFQPGGTNATTSGDSTLLMENPRTAITSDVFDWNDDDVYQFRFLGDQQVYLDGFIKAIENKGVGKTIARPNLVVKDGEEASFLVGGEAAVVVSTQDDIEVQFKEYGTRLTFKTEVLYDERIRISVEPEVSALDFVNGVTVNDIVIPSFTSTKIKTVVELAENETLMIGGLLRQQETTTETGVPFLRRLPIVGKLFQSIDRDWQDTELLVLVTPKFVKPERDPIREDAPEYDILSKATQMKPHRVSDEHAEAIDKYIKENKRYYTDAIISEVKEIAAAKEIKAPRKVKKVSPASSLKELEEALSAISKKRKSEQERRGTSVATKKKAEKSDSLDRPLEETSNRGYLYYKGKGYESRSYDKTSEK